MNLLKRDHDLIKVRNYCKIYVELEFVIDRVQNDDWYITLANDFLCLNVSDLLYLRMAGHITDDEVKSLFIKRCHDKRNEVKMLIRKLCKSIFDNHTADLKDEVVCKLGSVDIESEFDSAADFLRGMSLNG